jgi:hypothetical protein
MVLPVVLAPQGYRPQLVRDIPAVNTQLAQIGRVLNEPPVVAVAMQVLYAAPAKMYAGMMVYADGVTWNPGAGEGIYRRNLAGAWVFVG